MLRGRWRLPGAGPELGSRGLAWILLLVLVTASKNQNNSKMQVFQTLIKPIILFVFIMKLTSKIACPTKSSIM